MDTPDLEGAIDTAVEFQMPVEISFGDLVRAGILSYSDDGETLLEGEMLNLTLITRIVTIQNTQLFP